MCRPTSKIFRALPYAISQSNFPGHTKSACNSAFQVRIMQNMTCKESPCRGFGSLPHPHPVGDPDPCRVNPGATPGSKYDHEYVFISLVGACKFSTASLSFIRSLKYRCKLLSNRAPFPQTTDVTFIFPSVNWSIPHKQKRKYDVIWVL